MRFLLSLLLITYAFAKINITTFASPFVQTIINDQNKTLRYEGVVYFKAPDKLLWIYTKPIQKSILFRNQKVLVVEPELEQATIKRVATKNLFSILHKAKRSGDHYTITYDKKHFYIYMKKGVLKRVEYRDEFNNINKIFFTTPQQNTPLDSKLFEVTIDPSFDIIYQ